MVTADITKRSFVAKKVVLLYGFLCCMIVCYCTETGDFKIDTMGTYHGLTLKSVSEGVTNRHQEQQVKPGVIPVVWFPW